MSFFKDGLLSGSYPSVQNGIVYVDPTSKELNENDESLSTESRASQTSIFVAILNLIKSLFGGGIMV